MLKTTRSTERCPHLPEADARKSAKIALRGGGVSAEMIGKDFAEARSVLRDPSARQAGFLADLVNRFGTMRAPILYLSGSAHRRQRSATARFFAPRTVTTAYRALMVNTTDRLVGRLTLDGGADLDELALELAVTVAAEIVGLTESNSAEMAKRLDTLTSGNYGASNLAARLLGYLRG